MKTIKISVLACLAILFTTSSFAQRGGGGYNRGYNHYHSNRSYYQPRSYVSVNVGPRYNYRPNYRPAPVYRYGPVYRPVYYRSPRAYVHFGPVFGVRMNVLPFGYSSIYVGGNPYYYNNGIYYRNYNNSSSYEVVAPPLDAVVNKLPSNTTVTMIDGQKYYQLGGTFYQEEFNENNKVTYRVVGTDGVVDTRSATDNQQATTDDQYQQQATEEEQQPAPTIGSRFDQLPEGSKVQVINQQKYFSTPGGVYYKEVIEGDKIRYEVTNVQ